jgi:small subunit ribosomal protein S3
VEIVISGKLRTERARFEKFRAGYFPRCGEPALRYTRKAEIHVQLKPGIIGVRVKLMPPDAIFPDKIQIITEAPLAEEKPVELKHEVKEEPKTEVKEEVEVEAEEVAEETAEAVTEEKAVDTTETKENTEVTK